MLAFVHKHIYIHIHTYILHTSTYIYIHLYTSTYIYIHIHTYTYMFAIFTHLRLICETYVFILYKDVYPKDIPIPWAFFSGQRHHHDLWPGGGPGSLSSSDASLCQGAIIGFGPASQVQGCTNDILHMHINIHIYIYVYIYIYTIYNAYNAYI